MRVRVLVVFFLTLTMSKGLAQGPQCDDPEIPEGDLKVFSPDIDPNPLAPVVEAGEGDFIFLVSNDNGSYQSGDAQLKIILTDVIAPNGIGDLSSVQEPVGEYWSWSYDADLRTFTGDQIADIPSDYAEQITIGILVTANSTQENKTNGFEVDIAFPNGLACNASTANDHIDRRTFTRPSVLPIHILEFQANVQRSKEVQISWRIEDTEGTFTNIELQRSTDTDDWITIFASSDAVNNLNRRFVDTDPASLNFYRLKVQELDGSFAYSNLERITMQRVDRINIAPNPASHFFRIRNLGSDNSRLSIFDEMGRMVHQVSKLEEAIVSIPSSLADGLYTLKLTNLESGQVTPIMLQIVK